MKVRSGMMACTGNVKRSEADAQLVKERQEGNGNCINWEVSACGGGVIIFVSRIDVLVGLEGGGGK